jgi:TolB protein
VTVLAFAAAAVVLGTTASAVPRATNGPIAFRRFVDPLTSAIFVVNANGVGERQLTAPRTGDDDDLPDWAAEGRRLAFERIATRGEVWVVGSDGRGLHRLGPDCAAVLPPRCEDRSSPAWSPDGRWIAYTRAWGAVRRNQIEHAELWLMDAGGRRAHGLTQLTKANPYAADAAHPSWSPDGRRLVFEVINAAKGRPANRRALFVLARDGSRLRRITPWALNAGDSPDWSPDGTRILFRSVPRNDADRPGGELYTIRPDGSGLRRLTRFGPETILHDASFSPDGRWIVLSKGGLTGEPDLYVMRANGTGLRRLTRTPRWESAPAWGPHR